MRPITGFIVGVILAMTVSAESLLQGTVISGNDGVRWKGLDLGKEHVITIVGWNPGSTTNANQMNYARVNCSRGFRYVRYIIPVGKGEDKISAEIRYIA